MRDHVDDIHKAGAELVIVGNGNAKFANSFKTKLNLTTPLYIDPTLAAYQAAGLKRGKLATIGPRVWLPALRALFTGNLPRGVQGDAYQQGGAFVILPNNKVIYSHISKRSSDRPKVSAILKALQKGNRE